MKNWLKAFGGCLAVVLALVGMGTLYNASPTAFGIVGGTGVFFSIVWLVKTGLDDNGQYWD